MVVLTVWVKAKKSSLKKLLFGVSYWFITVILIRRLRGSLGSFGL